MTDRKMPYNVEAEESVLGAILLDSAIASDVFLIVTEEDFFSPRARKVFAAMVAVIGSHGVVDEVLLGAELERRGELEEIGAGYLVSLIEKVPVASSACLYARIVREKSMLRALIRVTSEIQVDAFTSDSPAVEQQDSAEQKVFEVGRENTRVEFSPVSAVIDGAFKRLENHEADADAVFSGFFALDEMTCGFKPSELIIVAGRPSMGKTSFAMSVALNAALSGKSIGIFSLEVGREQVVQNLVCSFALIDGHRARARTLTIDDWSSLVEQGRRLVDTKIYLDDSSGLTPMTLRAKARRLYARHSLDLVIVDYIQLMDADEKANGNRQLEISSISRSLKGLSREIGVPVMALSQLSRGVESREDKRPRMSDLRESGAIEQDADLVLLLYRDEYYNPTKEESKGKAEVIIAKQRNGPTGTVELAFLSNCLRFESTLEPLSATS